MIFGWNTLGAFYSETTHEIVSFIGCSFHYTMLLWLGCKPTPHKLTILPALVEQTFFLKHTSSVFT